MDREGFGPLPFSIRDAVTQEQVDADAYGAPLLGGPGLTPNPLSLATVEELVTELKTRYDALVLGGMVVSRKGNKSRIQKWFKGDYFTTLGMIHFLKVDQEALEDDEEEWDEEE